MKCPSNWGPPWAGYLDHVPLPSLRNSEHYVAKLAEACPVQSSALEGKRIACLNSEGMEALFHRLAMNSLRYPEIPSHYRTEAEKLTNETDLWEVWNEHRSEDPYRFQHWLNEPFGGQLLEGDNGELLEGTAQATGETRREVLAWNVEEVRAELLAELGIENV